MVHPVLESLAVLFGAGDNGAASSQPVDDANIGEIELGRFCGASLVASAICGQPRAKQGILQDLKIASYGRRRYTTLPSDVGEVDTFTVTQRGDIEEAGECGQPAYQSFGGYFFLQVVPNVGFEHPIGFVRLVGSGQVSVVEQSIQVEVAAQFSCCQPA